MQSTRPALVSLGEGSAVTDKDKPETAEDVGLLDMLRGVDWIEAKSFYSCKVTFGEKGDYARLLAVSGGVVTMALALMEKAQGAVVRLNRAEDAEAIVAALGEILNEERRENTWTVIEEIFTRCVAELSLKEYADAFGVPEPVYPGPDAPVAERDAFVRGLPIKLVARVLAGVAVHLGN